MKLSKLILGGILLLSNAVFAQININSATAEELEKLNGIGAVKAKAIVEYREKNGAFTKVEDLLKVDGIGKGILEKIKDEVSIEPNASPTATGETSTDAESKKDVAVTDSTATPSASPSASASPEAEPKAKADTDKSDKKDDSKAKEAKAGEAVKK